MALPDRLVDHGKELKRYGVAFAVFPAGAKWASEIHRAPDDGSGPAGEAGSPDVGSAVVVGYLNPGQQKFVDDSIGSNSAIFHFRVRHVREGYTPSGFTGWLACKSELIPDVLPLIPAEATKAADLSIDSDSGDMTIEVNGSRKVRSVVWDVDIGDLDDWPSDPDASTTFTNNTDTEGDVSIDVTAETSGEPGGSRLAPVGQIVRATIFFYAGPDATGQFLGSLRISNIRGQSGSSPLPANGVAVVHSWEQDKAAGFGKYKAVLSITVGVDVDSINFTAVDAPVTVNVNTNQDLSAGELSDLFLEVKISGFDSATSDGCLFTVTGFDDVGGTGGSGGAGATANLGKFVPVAGADVNTSGVDDLTNVTFDAPIANELMAFTSATEVENKTLAELGISTVAAIGDLTDVTITAVADDNALMFDSVSGLWKNRFLDAGDLKTGTLGTARGGTNQTSGGTGELLLGFGGGWIKLVAGTLGQFLRPNGIGQLAWETVSVGVADHGALTGLADDDHSQYVHISTARSITALHDFTNPSGLKTDAITESGTNAGVTVDGLLIKDAGIPSAAVTAHEAALTILESQITDGSILARVAGSETYTGNNTYTATETKVPWFDLGTKTTDFDIDPADGDRQKVVVNGTLEMGGVNFNDGNSVMVAVDYESLGVLSFGSEFKFGAPGVPTPSDTDLKTDFFMFTEAPSGLIAAWAILGFDSPS